jgi:glutathione synthase/RimK-type ligase-like ATP-grasp enzyme
MINEKKIPKEVLELSKSAFKALGMNFGCVDIVECENMEGNNYLIMEVNTSVLTDLFDHCKYGKLVELTRKSIIKRLNNHDLIIDHKEESDFTEIKKNNLVDKNQLLSYKGKAKLKKKCIEEACKSLDVNVDFYSQDYLAVIDNDIFMVNFDTGINNSISIDVCNDKDITSKILNLSNIPHVEHELFKTPEEDKGAGIMDSIFEKARE